MMTFRELKAQLLADYGIRSEWVESGGGQWCLTVQVGDSSEYGEWLEIGSPEFNFVNEYDTPVTMFSVTLVENGDTELWGESIGAHAMARLVAREMLERSGMLLP
jgi:hypothetical protein